MHSDKPRILSEYLGREVKFIPIDYTKNNNYEELSTILQDADFIIASSTGAVFGRYVAHKYNISLISLNPVISIEKTFTKMGVPVPLIPDSDAVLSEIVFINKDDGLINYRDTLKKYKKRAVVFNVGGHGFFNLIETIPPMKKFMKENFSL